MLFLLKCQMPRGVINTYDIDPYITEEARNLNNTQKKSLAQSEVRLANHRTEI